MELERDPQTIREMTTPDLIRWRTDAATAMQANPDDTSLITLYRLSTEEKGNRVREADQPQAAATSGARPKPTKRKRRGPRLDRHAWGMWGHWD